MKTPSDHEADGASRRPRPGRELADQLDISLLALSLVGLVAGGVFDLLGQSRTADAAWAAVGMLGAAYSLWGVASALARKRLGVDVIALLALVGAIWVHEYLASAVIAMMLATGRGLEGWAAKRARHDLHSLLERAPKVAHLYTGRSLGTVPVESLRPGDLVLVAPGEVVPVDGRAVTPAVLDESAMTGEALPVERFNEAVRSGVINAGSPFDLLVTARAEDSAYAAMVRLVREAESSPAPLVRVADRVALWFLAFTVAITASAWFVGGMGRAVAVLVVATPCPLILATPVALVSGLSRAARRGVVVKGGAALEKLAACTTLLIDKTGTVTCGRPVLVQIITTGKIPERDLLRLAGSLEQVSPHVIADSIVGAAKGQGLDLELPAGFEEVPGHGARGTVGAHRVAVGNADWAGLDGVPAWAASAQRTASLQGALTAFVAVDDEPSGLLVFEDPLRPDSARTVRSLRRRGIERIVMVSGDRPEVARSVGDHIGVDQVYAQCTPAKKLEVVRAERTKAGTIMLGDGINDAPALALADVGMAMAARGATASSDAADVVLTVDRIGRVGEARAIALRSKRIALQSAIAGMAMSVIAMEVAAFGFLRPLWGALLQEGIDVAVILNALRALRPAPYEIQLSQEECSLTARFHSEHQAIRAALERLRNVADLLGPGRPEAGMGEVREVHRILVTDVEPHEEAEEKVLYPVLDHLLGGTDPTGPMSRGHVEISRQIRQLGEMIEAIGGKQPDEADLAELRRLLYGLEAVLRLHTAQEEEHYLSLGEH